MTSTIIYNYSQKKDEKPVAPDKTYTFRVFKQSYEHLKSGTSLTKGIKWDSGDFRIPLGFNMTLYEKTKDTITLSGGSILSFDNLNKDSVTTFIAPVMEDLCDAGLDPLKNEEGSEGGLSNIIYTTEGNPGKRICKIEVRDAGFYNERAKKTGNSSKVSFQVWLYEENNSIEFRFGEVHISEPFENLFNGNEGFMSGLAKNFNKSTLQSEGSNFLEGESSDPKMVSLPNTLSKAVSQKIEKGLVFRFNYVPQPARDLKYNSETSILMYPNPAKDKLFFGSVPEEFMGNRVVFYDVAGKEIYNTHLDYMLDISHLSNGVYYVDVFNKENTNVISRKLIVEK